MDDEDDEVFILLDQALVLVAQVVVVVESLVLAIEMMELHDLVVDDEVLDPLVWDENIRVVQAVRELLLSDIRFHSFQETHLKYLPFCIYFAPS